MLISNLALIGAAVGGVSAAAGTAVALGRLLKRPELGWLLYPFVVLALPVFWFALNPILALRTSQGVNFLAALIPIVCVTALVGIAWLVNGVVSVQGVRGVLGPLLLPLLAVVACNIASSIFGGGLIKGADIIFGWGYISLTYLIIVNTLRSESTQESLVRAMVFSLTTMAVLGVIAWMILGEGYGANLFALSGVPILEKNHTALLLEQGIFLAAGPLVVTNARKRPRWYKTAIAIMVIGLIFTRSRGGWISAGVGMIALVLLSSWKHKARFSKLFLSVFAVGIVVGSLFAFSPTLQQRADQLDPTSSPRRLTKNLAGLRALLGAPAIGFGVNNVNLVDLGFTDSPLEDRLLQGRAGGTANFYLRVGVETGFVGLTAFLWLVGATLWVLYQPLRRVRDPDRWAIHVGYFAGSVANLVHHLFIGTLLPFSWIYFFFGIAAAMWSPERPLRRVASRYHELVGRVPRLSSQLSVDQK